MKTLITAALVLIFFSASAYADDYLIYPAGPDVGVGQTYIITPTIVPQGNPGGLPPIQYTAPIAPTIAPSPQLYFDLDHARDLQLQQLQPQQQVQPVAQFQSTNRILWSAEVLTNKNGLQIYWRGTFFTKEDCDATFIDTGKVTGYKAWTDWKQITNNIIGEFCVPISFDISMVR